MQTLERSRSFLIVTERGKAGTKGGVAAPDMR